MFSETDQLSGYRKIAERTQPDYVPLVLENDTENICEFVDNAFDMLFDDFKRGEPLFRTQIKHELLGASYFRERKNIFNEQFLISNHMVKCYFKQEDEVKENGLHYKVKVKLPLIEMRELIPHSYISPWAFPSLLIFNKHNPCSANLSPTGIMNVTGGYNLQQLKDGIKFFSHVVIKTIKQVSGKKVVLDDIHFKVRMASNKIGGKTFNILALNDYCISNNITSVYEEGRINRIQIFPFPRTLPSVAVNIFPSGGLTMYGFTMFYQADAIINMLEHWIWLFLRVDTEFMGWDRYIRMRSKAEEKRLESSLNRKIQKLSFGKRKLAQKKT